MNEFPTLDDMNDRLGVRYPLQEKQYEFCKAYVSHKTGMRAVREAGYTHSTPGAQSSAAYRLLRLQKVRDCISILGGEVSE